MFVRLTSWMALLARSAASKDAGLLVLRQEVAVLGRQNPKPKLDWPDRMVFAALARLLPGSLRMCRLVTPGTLFGRHRRLARWRWAYPHQGGRPAVDARLAALTGQIARENPGWGYKQIQGELPGLGKWAETMREFCKRARRPPPAVDDQIALRAARSGPTSWKPGTCSAHSGSCAASSPPWTTHPLTSHPAPRRR